MAAADYTSVVQELYISYFGRPADPIGLANYTAALNAANAPTDLAGVLAAYNTSPAIKGLVDSFGASAESKAMYGTDVIKFVASVYTNVLNRTADLEGAKYWVDAIQNHGLSMSKAAAEIMAGALSNTSELGLIDAQVVLKKVAIATNFTTAINSPDDQSAELLNAYQGDAAAAAARHLLSTVRADSDVTAFQADVQHTLTELAHPTPVVPPVPVPTAQLTLTVTQDDAFGTAGNDTFTARVAQNQNGEQTNQLATGDQIHGGDGVDTLNAKVQMASALNNGPASAILAETDGLEKANFTALSVDNSLSSIARHEIVTINAKEMLGLTTVSSVQSDASLVIENLTTLKDNGLYAEKRNTEEVTIRMDHTGNDAAVDAESDLTVLFDNDYLTAGKANTSAAFYWLLDEKAEYQRLTGAVAATTGRLNAINVDGIRFSYMKNPTDTAPTVVELFNKELWDQNKDGHTLDSHVKFTNMLKAELADAIAGDATLAGSTIELQNIFHKTGIEGGLQSEDIPAIVLTLGNHQTVTPLGFHQVADTLDGYYDVFGLVSNPGDVKDLPVTSTIELEKVGRGAEGGDLTVGAMSTNHTTFNGGADANNNVNVWNYSDSARKEGIEHFNITVSGDDTQFSDLASLQSTNNTLAIVDIAWKSGSLADLIIGNHNTVGAVPNGAVQDSAVGIYSVFDDDMTSVKNNALKDVRDFSAVNNNSSVVGTKTITTDVTVYASLTDEVVAKYMNLVDTDGNPVEVKSTTTEGAITTVAQNADFVYNFGSGNDLLNINLSKLNLAQSGTTNREDFSFVTSTGAGNDTVQTQIGNGAGVTTSDWYINSKLEKNLTINTGEGNDTVQTFGAGVWNINLGAGNDVVYSDNSGNQMNLADDFGVLKNGVAVKTEFNGVNFNSGRAVWVLNTADQVSTTVALSEERNVDDDTTVANDGLHSDTNDTGAFLGGALTVSLRGVTSAATKITTNNTSDLALNNLIKKTIQGDVFLSKLIVAEDGPANTLVIRSLVDGEHATNDFTVNIAPGVISTLSATDLAAFNLANKTAFTTTADVQTYVNAQIAAWVADPDYDSMLANDGVSTLTGKDSTAAVASTIIDGAGNDTIVLSTSGLDQETVILTNDGQRDVIYNITNAVISGLREADYTAGKGDILSLADGTMTADGVTVTAPTVYSTWADITAHGTKVTDATGVSYTVTVNLLGGVVPPVVVPGGGLTAAKAISAAGTTTDAGAGTATTYTLSAGTYTHTINGFGSGDVLKMFAGAAVTVVPDTDNADGAQSVTFADAATGGIVTIVLTGMTAAQDAALFNQASINTAFGAGTLV